MKLLKESRFIDPSRFDRAGSVWILDKKSRKIKRVIDKVMKQGFYSEFDIGEIVYYDGGMNVKVAKVVNIHDNHRYEIEFDGRRLIVPEDTLFKTEVTIK